MKEVIKFNTNNNNTKKNLKKMSKVNTRRTQCIYLAKLEQI